MRWLYIPEMQEMRDWLEEIPQVEGSAVLQEEGVQEHARKEDRVESKVFSLQCRRSIMNLILKKLILVLFLFPLLSDLHSYLLIKFFIFTSILPCPMMSRAFIVSLYTASYCVTFYPT